jgi:hypothetical protein
MLGTDLSNANSIVDQPLQTETVFAAVGLPLQIALIHLLLFVGAFSFYVTSWPEAPVVQPDSGSYLRFAQDLSDFSIEQLHERTPGYPIFLLLTGSAPSPNRTLFHASLLLHLASIWLLAGILWRTGLSGMKITGFTILLLLPPFVEPAGYVLTETFAETMLVLTLASLVFWRVNHKTTWICVSAASIGFAALTRPTYQVLVVAVAASLTAAYLLGFTGFSRWREVIKSSLILISGTILIVGGYAYFNYRNFGYFGITYKLGISLTQKTVHVLERLPDEHAPVRDALIRGRNADLLASRGTELGYISAIVPELTRLTGLDEVQLSNYLLKLNLLLIRTAPLNYLQEVVMAFGRYGFPTSNELANFNSRLLQALWAVMHFILIGAFAFNLILVPSTATFLRTSKVLVEEFDSLIGLQKFAYGLAGTIVVYTAVISCFIDVGDPRHRVPTDAIIIFMLFLGSHLWWRQVKLIRAILKRAKAV